MTVFLSLSSLSVGFYLVLLVALYRDGRRRRQAREFGSGLRRVRRLRIVAGGGVPSNDVLWVPVTRVNWKPKADVPTISLSNTRSLANAPASEV
jgi:hypothetical protein